MGRICGKRWEAKYIQVFTTWTFLNKFLDRPFQEVLNTIKPQEHTEFMIWCAGQDDERTRKSFANPPPPPEYLTMQQYIHGVTQLNLRNVEASAKFLMHTRFCIKPPWPRPIILGQDNGVSYVLWPGEGFEEIYDDLSDNTLTHPFIHRLEIIQQNSRSTILFFVILGTLALGGGEDNITSATLKRDSSTLTPFSVVLSVKDKSIWLVQRDDYYDDYHNFVEVPKDAYMWQYLTGRKDSRSNFDVIRIMEFSEFSQLTESSAKSRNMFPRGVLETARRVHPKPYLLSHKDAVAAIPKKVENGRLGWKTECVEQI